MLTAFISEPHQLVPEGLLPSVPSNLTLSHLGSSLPDMSACHDVVILLYISGEGDVKGRGVAFTDASPGTTALVAQPSPGAVFNG